MMFLVGSELTPFKVLLYLPTIGFEPGSSRIETKGQKFCLLPELCVLSPQASQLGIHYIEYSWPITKRDTPF